MPSRERTPSNRPRWTTIALVSGGLAAVGLIGMALSLPDADHSPTNISVAPESNDLRREEQKQVYLPTAEFATSNDLDVLRAALAAYCESSDGYYVLSDTSIERMDNRKDTPLAQVPVALQCDGLTIASSVEIDEIFERPTQSSRDGMPLADSWSAFYKRFSGAKGLVSISMPLYFENGTKASVYLDGSCGPLCGSGWDVLLRKEDGKWVVEKRSSRWIS